MVLYVIETPRKKAVLKLTDGLAEQNIQLK